MFTPNALLKTRLEQAVFFSDPQVVMGGLRYTNRQLISESSEPLDVRLATWILWLHRNSGPGSIGIDRIVK